MIARLLRRWADGGLRRKAEDLRESRDEWRAVAKHLRRELGKAEAANATLRAVCDRYSASMKATSEQIQQMREGQ